MYCRLGISLMVGMKKMSQASCSAVLLMSLHFAFLASVSENWYCCAFSEVFGVVSILDGAVLQLYLRGDAVVSHSCFNLHVELFI